MKKVYVSEIEDPRRRGRPVIRRKDKVKEYMHERDANRRGIEQARMECVDRERWRLFCCGHPIGGCFQREQGIRNYR